MTTLDLRIQNDRDRFYVHVADDDYDIVKGKGFEIRYVGLSVILRRKEPGAHFTVRRGEDNFPVGFKYALQSKYAHPWLPLFGPLECRGEFVGNDVFLVLPSASRLPWPSVKAIKYSDDDRACQDLLEQRAKSLQELGEFVMKIPDYMAVYIGYNRLADFMKKNPWLEIDRDQSL